MTDGASAAGDELDATLALRDLLSEVTTRFAAAAIDGAEREARWIVEEASGHEGPEFALSLDRPATEREVVRIDAMTARRVAGEPLQYVLGRWAFRHLDLAVDSRVLIQRPETEVTAEVAIDAARRIAEPIVVDLGTGSGAIGLSVAWECRHAHVWATDRSSEALEVARANLAGLGRAGARVRLAAGDWFGALPDDLVGRVDVAVSNPPYVRLDDPLPPAVERWEPAAALRSGADGLDDIRSIIAAAPRWMSSGGAIVLEADPRQMSAIGDLLVRAGFVDPQVRPDLAGRERVVTAQWGLLPPAQRGPHPR